MIVAAQARPGALQKRPAKPCKRTGSPSLAAGPHSKGHLADAPCGGTATCIRGPGRDRLCRLVFRHWPSWSVFDSTTPFLLASAQLSSALSRRGSPSSCAAARHSSARSSQVGRTLNQGCVSTWTLLHVVVLRNTLGYSRLFFSRWASQFADGHAPPQQRFCKPYIRGPCISPPAATCAPRSLVCLFRFFRLRFPVTLASCNITLYAPPYHCY